MGVRASRDVRRPPPVVGGVLRNLAAERVAPAGEKMPSRLLVLDFRGNFKEVKSSPFYGRGCTSHSASSQDVYGLGASY